MNASKRRTNDISPDLRSLVEVYHRALQDQKTSMILIQEIECAISDELQKCSQKNALSDCIMDKYQGRL